MVAFFAAYALCTSYAFVVALHHVGGVVSYSLLAAVVVFTKLHLNFQTKHVATFYIDQEKKANGNEEIKCILTHRHLYVYIIADSNFNKSKLHFSYKYPGDGVSVKFPTYLLNK